MSRAVPTAEDILPLDEATTRLAKLLERLRLRERDRFIEAVEDGLADADAGRTLTDEELGDWIEREFS